MWKETNKECVRVNHWQTSKGHNLSPFNQTVLSIDKQIFSYKMYAYGVTSAGVFCPLLEGFPRALIFFKHHTETHSHPGALYGLKAAPLKYEWSHNSLTWGHKNSSCWGSWALLFCLTSGSLFFTRRTIFTDSSSKSSSTSSGSGGNTGSKFFWATVSWADSTAFTKRFTVKSTDK